MFLLDKSIIYVTFFGFFLQILIVVKSQTTIFKPSLRNGHIATLINNKLYILGGSINSDDNTSPKESFLCLDFSVSFNTHELRWVDLSNNNIFPSHAAAAEGGANNDTLFIYGGQSVDNETIALINAFDTKSHSWRVPKITGTPPTGTIDITAVMNYNGLIYLFGGSTNSPVSPPFVNDMFILDSVNLSWKKGSSINAPSPRNEYGAVFLPNKRIIYMGGFNGNGNGNGNEVFPLNEVFLYDTVNDNWTNQATTGLIPSARSSFSSVLGLDGKRIIIFGGLDSNATNKTPENSLYVLDLNDFNWYTPKLPGNIPSNRAFHKALIIGKYMVITFGIGYVQGNESDILLLDISNNDEYIWTTTFEPLPPPTHPSSPTIDTTQTKSNKPNNIGVIIGAFVGSLIGGGILLTGGFFSYKWYKYGRGQNEAIPSSEDIRDYSQKNFQVPEEIIQQAIPPRGQLVYGQVPAVQRNNSLQDLIAQAVREEVNNLRLSSHV